MKKLLYWSSFALFLILTALHIVSADGIGTIPQLQQFVATTSPAAAITQQVYGKSFRLTGQSTGCAQFSSVGVLTSSGSPCGGSGAPGGSVGQLQYNASGSFGGVATTTVTAGSGMSFSPFTVIGSSPITLTSTGGSGGSGTVGTSSQETKGQVAVWGTTNATPALLYSVATSTPTVTAPVTYSGTLGSFVGGISGTFGCTTSSAGVTGCLSGTDWTTFNNKGSGTVTAVSVASANGFAGSSSGGATPALTLSTTISGLLKGNGTAISAGANGTDYTLITAKDCTGIGHVLSVTAAGVFNCSADSGGSATAAGADTNVQYNDGGTNLGATTGFNFTKANNQLTIPVNGWYSMGGELVMYASSTNRATVLGYHAGGNATTTANKVGNTALGFQALNANTADWNTAVGSNALLKNTTGRFNTAIGDAPLNINTTGSFNTAVGEEAIGAMIGPLGNANVGVGNDVLHLFQQGSWNAAVGSYAMENAKYATNTTAIGEEAGHAIANAKLLNDTYLGAYAGYLNSSTTGNTTLGVQAGYSGSTGNLNTLVGLGAGFSNTTGSNNIVIGTYLDTPTVSTSGYLSIGNVLFGRNMYATEALSSTPMQTGLIGVGTTSPWAQLSVNPDNLGSGLPGFVVGSSTATQLIVAAGGNVGVGTTSPGTIFSVQGVANFHTATSTFSATGGINLTSGCFSIAGTCVGGSSLSTPVSIANGGTFATSQTTNGINYFDGTKITSGTVLTLNNSLFGVGTTTPRYTGQFASTTAPQLVLTGDDIDPGAAFREKGGHLYVASTSPTTFASSSIAAIDINMNAGVSQGLSVATSTAAGAAISTALINLGVNTVSTNASTTIHMGRLQWEGMDAGGAYRCTFITAAGALTTISGLCNN